MVVVKHYFRETISECEVFEIEFALSLTSTLFFFHFFQTTSTIPFFRQPAQPRNGEEIFARETPREKKDEENKAKIDKKVKKRWRGKARNDAWHRLQVMQEKRRTILHYETMQEKRCI